MEESDHKMAISRPLKLYKLCLDSIVEFTCNYRNRSKPRNDFICLPPLVQADLYEMIFNVSPSCIERPEWFALSTFSMLLQVRSKRLFLIKCYQWLLNAGHNIQKQHLNTFVLSVSVYTLQHTRSEEQRVELINIGLRMADFLNDGGWYKYSTSFLELTETMLKDREDDDSISKLLELYGLQLYATSKYCDFLKAAETHEKLRNIIEKCEKLKLFPSALADVYCNISIYHFVHNRYENAHAWAADALNLISSDLSKKTTIKILRQTSKTCVQRRRYLQAGLLITQAMALGESIPSFPMASDILMDYGYYLLNSDNVELSVTNYRKALKIRLQIYRSNNINIAIASADLAFALYVNQYNCGRFREAEQIAVSALHHIEPILPEDHYFQSSVKRVRALILEEIAMESHPDFVKKNVLLRTAEDLHNSASKIVFKLLGEKNLPTAKHYGNLGRLYQSMGQFEKAEKFQQKAIALKEELFGPNDYEVGVSVGHLASLYNYHMQEYKKAEKLYLRSIAINIRLFGPCYSALEYDYKGLINVYRKKLNIENRILYADKLTEWFDMRLRVDRESRELKIMSPDSIIRSFAKLRDQEISLKAERAKSADWCQKALDKLAL